MRLRSVSAFQQVIRGGGCPEVSGRRTRLDEFARFEVGAAVGALSSRFISRSRETALCRRCTQGQRIRVPRPIQATRSYSPAWRERELDAVLRTQLRAECHCYLESLERWREQVPRSRPSPLRVMGHAAEQAHSLLVHPSLDRLVAPEARRPSLSNSDAPSWLL